MNCKLDVDDVLRERLGLVPRRMECACARDPLPVRVGHGCLCSGCGAQCTECPGYGYAQAPEKRFHQILSRVRTTINRRLKVRGRPPGFVRLPAADIGVLVRKRRSEEGDHWIHAYVDVGPPVRVFDVIVIADRRYR